MGEGVVAFLDALGIKGIWARAEPREVISSWNKVIGIFDRTIKEAQNKAGDVFKGCHIAAFSDTVIVILKGQDPSRLIPLMGEVLMCPIFAGILYGIYLRCVISVGKFYQSKTLIIGPAIDEAAEWYTQPDWIGVSTAPSASFGLERFVDQGIDISKWFVRYKIPMKDGIEENGWAVAWPKRAPIEPLDNREKVTSRTAILEAFASRPISISAASKYRNTLSFFDFVIGLSNKRGKRRT